jgi:hypothetical protein
MKDAEKEGGIMLEILFILLIVFFVLIFFYKQSADEFHILQIDQTTLDTLPELLAEAHPLVIRGLGTPKILTEEILKGNHRAQTLPVAIPHVLHQYLANPKGKTLVPLGIEVRKQAANELGLQVWAEHVWFPRIKEENPLAYALSMDSEVYISSMGMRMTTAAYTLIYPTNGTFTGSILVSGNTKFMPVWEGLFVSEMKPSEYPLLNEVQFMDIILRPGHMLILPPHWILSLKSSDTLPVFAWIEVHHPISRLAKTLA